jgi:hypothetical protein
MKRKSFLAVNIAASLVASAFTASASPAISTSSVDAVQISRTHLEKALGGGSYVTGVAETSFGSWVPRAVHVHVEVYDSNGKLLADKIDKLNSSLLVPWQRNPRPSVSYVVFLPLVPSQIAKVSVVEHSGHTHPYL